MDFIVALPISNGFNAITVYVDRLTKMVHLSASETTNTSRDVAFDLENTVFKLHGSPVEIVSDRDGKFTSMHWAHFLKEYNIKHSMSTSYHPQSDGQTERTNRTLEQIIRMSINYSQNNWFYLLPSVEFALNNSKSASTLYSPFYLNYGYNPTIPKTTPFKLDKETPADTPLDMHATLEMVKRNIKRAQESQAKYHNEKHDAEEFEIGDPVMLKTDHLHLQYDTFRKTKKFTAKYIGPFTIIDKINRNAYKLQLPTHLNKVHPTINIQYLKKYNSSDQFPQRSSNATQIPKFSDQNTVHRVERIHDSRLSGKSKKTQYLVKWEGLPEEDSTWMNESLIHDLENGKFQIDLYRSYKGHTETRPGGNVRKLTIRLPNLLTKQSDVIAKNIK